MSFIKFDEKLFPIVIVYTDKKTLTEAEIDEYLQIMTDYYTKNKGKDIFIIYDISILKALDARNRIKIGRWLEEQEETIKNAVAGVCYVQTNILQKVILQGIFAIKTPVWPHKVVRSIEEGIDWAKSQKNN